MPGVSRLTRHRARRPGAVQCGGADSNPAAASLGDRDPQVAGYDAGEGGGESGSQLRAAGGVCGTVSSSQSERAESCEWRQLGVLQERGMLGGGGLAVRTFMQGTFGLQD